jgi:hypothetical protein
MIAKWLIVELKNKKRVKLRVVEQHFSRFRLHKKKRYVEGLLALEYIH